jgi:hypothetical protein
MSKEYDKYLMEHRAGVADAWKWMLKNICGDLSADSIYVVPYFITTHDASKYSLKEYDYYDAYFYGNRSKDVVKRFEQAWLNHIHENPHHWQHWILMEDDPETGEPFKCLEMPICYVYEMICDWWSFSFRKGNLKEIFDWYEEHKKTIKLHPNTRKEVERILGLIREKLEDEES